MGSTLNNAGSIERRIVGHLCSSTFAMLPPEAVHSTKEHVLHTIGTSLAGSSAPGVAELVEVFKETGPTGRSSIFGWDVSTSPANAAMVNSLMGHAHDFDNNDDRIAYKSSVCSVPAAFAVAEHLGNVSGRELITAICVGVDLGIRMGLAVRPYPTHSIAPVLGPFAAAATAARLMKLSEAQVWSALGLALCGVAPAGLSTGGNTYTKRFTAGAATAKGVFAALLASKGFKAEQPIFAGRGSYYVTITGSEGDLDRLLTGLSSSFEIVNVGPKPYPCCRFTHCSIDGALQLMQNHYVNVQSIERVDVTVGARDYAAVFGGSDGLQSRQEPQSIVDAQFSIPYTVAVALLARGISLDDFTAGAIRRPEVISLAKKVYPIVDESLDDFNAAVKPARVEIILKSGEKFGRLVEYPKGNPKSPVAFNEIVANFHACCRYAHSQISQESAHAAVEAISNLPDTEDVSTIPQLLS